MLVLERMEMPRWKVCGACVGAGALSVIREVGLGDLAVAAGAVPLGELVVESSRRRAVLPLVGGAAWSRAAMDEALLRAAEREGAICWTGAHARIGRAGAGHRVVQVRRGGGTFEVRARVVLDAAGLGGAPHPTGDRGSVRSDARIGIGAVIQNAELRRVGPPRAASHAEGALELPLGRIHMVVGRHGYVGLVRLEDGTVDVAAAIDASLLRGGPPEEAVDGILRTAGMRLDGDLVHGWKGTPPLTRSAARLAEPRLFRIGDAMGYVEPFTGEGIGWALASARAVAPLALRGIEGWEASLERTWEAYGRGRAARARLLCRAVSRGLRRPTVVNGVLALLGRAPVLAAPWVRHAGRVPAPPETKGQGAAGPLGRGDGEEAA